MPNLSKTHLLDRRAQDLIAEGGAGNSDELVTTTELASWLRVSPAWVEIGRGKGYGPPYVRIGPRRIRYRRADVLRWLESRVHARSISRRPSSETRG